MARWKARSRAFSPYDEAFENYSCAVCAAVEAASEGDQERSEVLHSPRCRRLHSVLTRNQPDGHRVGRHLFLLCWGNQCQVCMLLLTTCPFLPEHLQQIFWQLSRAVQCAKYVTGIRTLQLQRSGKQSVLKEFAEVPSASLHLLQLMKTLLPCALGGRRASDLSLLHCRGAGAIEPPRSETNSSPTFCELLAEKLNVPFGLHSRG